VERLRVALTSLWTDPSIEEITAEDLCGDYIDHADAAALRAAFEFEGED
jgi:hypothetical protein